MDLCKECNDNPCTCNETYNQYLTRQAQIQASNGPISVMRVRRPRKGEEVVGYESTSDAVYKHTETEKAAEEGKNDNAD